MKDKEVEIFERRLTGGERVAVYPTFERFGVSSLTRRRPELLREPKFITDVHLGKLARYLRLLGFDTVYERELDDAAIASCARDERRTHRERRRNSQRLLADSDCPILLPSKRGGQECGLLLCSAFT